MTNKTRISENEGRRAELTGITVSKYSPTEYRGPRDDATVAEIGLFSPKFEALSCARRLGVAKPGASAAIVIQIEIHEIEFAGLTPFAIRESERRGWPLVRISPDLR